MFSWGSGHWAWRRERERERDRQRDRERVTVASLIIRSSVSCEPTATNYCTVQSRPLFSPISLPVCSHSALCHPQSGSRGKRLGPDITRPSSPAWFVCKVISCPLPAFILRDACACAADAICWSRLWCHIQPRVSFPKPGVWEDEELLGHLLLGYQFDHSFDSMLLSVGNDFGCALLFDGFYYGWAIKHAADMGRHSRVQISQVSVGHFYRHF